jgi:hypothetical protein
MRPLVCEVCGAGASIAVRFLYGDKPAKHWRFYCPMHDARLGSPGHDRSGWAPWQLDEVADISPL